MDNKLSDRYKIFTETQGTEVIYFVKKRWLWLFWSTLTFYCMERDMIFRYTFDTAIEAKEWIIKETMKPIVKEVMP